MLLDHLDQMIDEADQQLAAVLAGTFDPEFAAYKRRLISEGKKRRIAAVAVGHRAHRLAFAMLRSQRPYDASSWSAVTGRSVMAQAPNGVHQNDVTCLSPDNTLSERFITHKRAALG